MKWYTYVICLVLIVMGTFCGIQFYQELKAESYVNGSIDITNKFSQESFNYSSTSLVFYHDEIYDDTDTYTFDKALTKTEDFNGLTNTYQVTLNNYVLTNAEVNAGSIYATVNVDFYDTNGKIVQQADMQISILFLSGKTQLTIITKGKANASFLEQYFADNGIRLHVNQIIKEVKP